MTRARDLGIPLEGIPGALNAITDVPGVQVGHATLISGSGKLVVGPGPVRTGGTAILPRGRVYDPCFAGMYTLNGNGEMTGAAWVEESGFLETPILLTNTHAVGAVHQAAVKWICQNRFYDHTGSPIFWTLPVVAETFDGRLNDINGFHVKEEHVFAALDAASGGPVAEGGVGGGTGMICYMYKGGIGAASRRLSGPAGEFTLGALVQANYGARNHLTVAGAPVGKEMTGLLPILHNPDPHPCSGSIIVILATDAPLLPHQLKRLARRVPMGMARLGGVGAHTSGDIFLAFSTANPQAFNRIEAQCLQMLPNDLMTPFFEAVVQATEEAILNALVAAETMSGVNDSIVYALPHEELRQVLRKYNRLL
ncbi:MAG: P1 family peptidase [Chloroflexi bacterium]|nr:P1 family peptidase [Chloroflexota bacterium]